MPKVLNIKTDELTANSVYIGCPTKWGNLNYIGFNCTREQAIQRYIDEKSKDKVFIKMVKKELRGKDLVCNCAPKDCHGDWLLKIANE